MGKILFVIALSVIAVLNVVNSKDIAHKRVVRSPYYGDGWPPPAPGPPPPRFYPPPPGYPGYYVRPPMPRQYYPPPPPPFPPRFHHNPHWHRVINSGEDSNESSEEQGDYNEAVAVAGGQNGVHTFTSASAGVKGSQAVSNRTMSNISDHSSELQSNQNVQPQTQLNESSFNKSNNTPAISNSDNSSSGLISAGNFSKLANLQSDFANSSASDFNVQASGANAAVSSSIQSNDQLDKLSHRLPANNDMESLKNKVIVNANLPEVNTVNPVNIAQNTDSGLNTQSQGAETQQSIYDQVDKYHRNTISKEIGMQTPEGPSLSVLPGSQNIQTSSNLESTDNQIHNNRQSDLSNQFLNLPSQYNPDSGIKSEPLLETSERHSYNQNFPEPKGQPFDHPNNAITGLSSPDLAMNGHSLTDAISEENLSSNRVQSNTQYFKHKNQLSSGDSTAHQVRQESSNGFIIPTGLTGGSSIKTDSQSSTFLDHNVDGNIGTQNVIHINSPSYENNVDISSKVPNIQPGTLNSGVNSQWSYNVGASSDSTLDDQSDMFQKASTKFGAKSVNSFDSLHPHFDQHKQLPKDDLKNLNDHQLPSEVDQSSQRGDIPQSFQDSNNNMNNGFAISDQTSSYTLYNNAPTSKTQSFGNFQSNNYNDLHSLDKKYIVPPNQNNNLDIQASTNSESQFINNSDYNTPNTGTNQSEPATGVIRNDDYSPHSFSKINHFSNNLNHFNSQYRQYSGNEGVSNFSNNKSGAAPNMSKPDIANELQNVIPINSVRHGSSTESPKTTPDGMSSLNDDNHHISGSYRDQIQPEEDNQSYLNIPPDNKQDVTLDDTTQSTSNVYSLPNNFRVSSSHSSDFLNTNSNYKSDHYTNVHSQQSTMFGSSKSNGDTQTIQFGEMSCVCTPRKGNLYVSNPYGQPSNLDSQYGSGSKAQAMDGFEIASSQDYGSPNLGNNQVTKDALPLKYEVSNIYLNTGADKSAHFDLNYDGQGLGPRDIIQSDNSPRGETGVTSTIKPTESLNIDYPSNDELTLPAKNLLPPKVDLQQTTPQMLKEKYSLTTPNPSDNTEFHQKHGHNDNGQEFLSYSYDESPTVEHQTPDFVNVGQSNQGHFESGKETGNPSGKYGTQLGLDGAFNLASQGLRSTNQNDCPTCTGNRYALSNANSKNNNAISVSVSN